MNILVCDDLSDRGLAELRSIPGATVDVKLKLPEPELLNTVPNYEAIVVRSSTQISARVIDAAKKLKAVARAGMGYDNIDVAAATRRGVVVMNTPGKNAVTTAEHTIAMLMALARNIPQAHASMHQGKWEKKKFTGVEIAGKTLGVVGLGNVGRRVARIAKGLDLSVVGFDPFVSKDLAGEIGVELVTLETLYARSDFISFHTVLNDTTKRMVNSKTIAQMKDRVRLINCARGELFDVEAVVAALNAEKIAGVATDVFEVEPPDSKHPLLCHERVITTPHLGASTDEAQEQVALAAAEQLKVFFTEDVVINGVNVPSVSKQVIEAIGRYLDLAEKLGSFLSQAGWKNVEEIHVECSGDLIKHQTAPITSAALVGFLKHLVSDSVNFVNAPSIAKDRGIQVRETRTAESGNYLSLVSLTVRAGNREEVVSGSVFGRDHLRVVRYNNFYLEVAPRGHLIVIHNEDRPGVVGRWGTIMGKNHINISQMQVALDPKTKAALSMVNVDTPVPESILQELAQVDGIQSVRQIKL